MASCHKIFGLLLLLFWVRGRTAGFCRRAWQGWQINNACLWMQFWPFAEVVFGADAAEAGVDALENFVRECGLPKKMSQLKSTVEITVNK